MKKTIPPFIALVLLAMFLFGYGCKKKSEPKDIQAIVYLDFSSSQDSTSIEQIYKKVRRLCEKLPSERSWTLNIRAIDKDRNVEVIYAMHMEKVANDGALAKDQYNNQLRKFAAKMNKALNNYRVKVIENKEYYEETCICNSLNNTISYSDPEAEQWVFVISDMLEECPKSSSVMKQHFSMCKGKFSNLKSKEQLIEDVKKFELAIPLKKVVAPEHLYFIQTGSEGYTDGYDFIHQKCLNSEEVIQVWHEILLKMGYNKEDVSKIHFVQNVPSKINFN